VTQCHENCRDNVDLSGEIKMRAKKRPDYQNHDRRCHYPFEPGPVGYCWGYAVMVDNGKAADHKAVRAYCKSCEFWKEKNGKAKKMVGAKKA